MRELIFLPGIIEQTQSAANAARLNDRSLWSEYHEIVEKSIKRITKAYDIDWVRLSRSLLDALDAMPAAQRHRLENRLGASFRSELASELHGNRPPREKLITRHLIKFLSYYLAPVPTAQGLNTRTSAKPDAHKTRHR